jgi:PadR family transcriptional regulator, regulatory protein AphA
MSTTSRTQYVVLGLLTLRPMSGYDLKQEIEASVGYFWQESYGQLYPTLRKLDAAGLIELEAENPDGRGKKVYRITDEGRVTLREWLEEPPAPQPVRNELLLKLFLGFNAPTEVLEGHLNEALDHFLELAQTYDRIARQLDAEADPTREDVLGRLTLDFGIHRVRAGAAWAESALERIRREKGKWIEAP